VPTARRRSGRALRPARDRSERPGGIHGGRLPFANSLTATLTPDSVAWSLAQDLRTALTPTTDVTDRLSGLERPGKPPAAARRAVPGAASRVVAATAELSGSQPETAQNLEHAAACVDRRGPGIQRDPVTRAERRQIAGTCLHECAQRAAEQLVIDLVPGGVEVRAEYEGSVEQMTPGLGGVAESVSITYGEALPPVGPGPTPGSPGRPFLGRPRRYVGRHGLSNASARP
jgi:hypothetical protein